MARKPFFAPAFWRDLAAACPHGPVDVEVVKAWFEMAWPKMQTYRYRNWKRAVATWWKRVSRAELEAARARIAAEAEDAENARLEALAETANASPPPAGAVRRSFDVSTGRNRA